MRKSHQNVNLDNRKFQHSGKESKRNVKLDDKKSQTSVKKTQKCKFK